MYRRKTLFSTSCSQGGLLLPMCVHVCYNAAFVGGHWYITRWNKYNAKKQD